jgi:hypothetical protein
MIQGKWSLKIGIQGCFFVGDRLLEIGGIEMTPKEWYLWISTKSRKSTQGQENKIIKYIWFGRYTFGVCVEVRELGTCRVIKNREDGLSGKISPSSKLMLQSILELEWI